MPLNPKLYPLNWRSISNKVRFELGGGKCRFCGAVHGEINKKTGKQIIIMAAHKNHEVDSEITSIEEDFIPLCGKCHVHFDLPFKKSKQVRNFFRRIRAYLLPFYDI